MNRITRVLLGGTFVVLGCGFFLYPNFREWNTQREVAQIIDKFDETYSEVLNDSPPNNLKTEKTQTSVQTNNKKEDKKKPKKNNSTEYTPGTHYDDDSAGDSATAHSNEDENLSHSPTEAESEESSSNDTSSDTFPESSDYTIDYRPYQSLYEKMVEYNYDLTANGQNIFDAWSYEQQPFELAEFNIDESNPIIGYIDIPDMEIKLPLMLGASPDNLRKGAAVLSETSMPIGGGSTNCVIAGHRGWNGSAYFQYIENMKIGSEVYVTNPWETLVYKCTSVKIIDPNDVSSILIQPGKDMITLFTCHPYVLGGGPYRYLAFCERVDTQKRQESGEIKNPDSERAPKPSESLVHTQSYVSNENAENLNIQENSSNTTNNNKEKEKEKNNNQTIELETPELPNTEGVVPVDYYSQQGNSNLNLIALEKTLRYMLPIMVIAFTIMSILFRNSKPKKSKKKKKKKRKSKRR